MSAGCRTTRPVLHLDEVVVEMGAARLLDGVSLDVAGGRIVAVVGPNGAGKTTLLDAISGMVDITSGRVHLDGRPTGGRRDVPPGVGRVFQGSPLPETLTVGEIATLATGSRAGAERLLERFRLSRHATAFVAELSTGMRRLLDLAVATASDPDMLLLDEPSSGLAPSEVERLGVLLMRWRDTSGGSVVLVEHDVGLVHRIADEVVVIDGGRVVGRGTPSEVLTGGVGVRPRVRRPSDEGFGVALSRVVANATEAAPLVRRRLSTWTLLRLGLREFAAGMASVLVLGVLNRVMKVELGISLVVVAAVLSSYNLAAPVALPIGYFSDTRPILGRRRTPYIIGGACLAGGAVALAPFVGDVLARGITPGSVLLGLGVFVVMGIGMYGAGSVFFALLADLAPAPERGHAASIVYLELMAGIFAGVALTGAVLDDTAAGMQTLFGLAGVLIVAFTTIAVWGQEKPRQQRRGAFTRRSFREAVGSIWRMSQARWFFAFMVAATIFIFLQQAVLEPYGGEVLGLNVRQTSAFNGMMTAGILAGMWVGGRPWADRYGYVQLARIGLAVAVVAFAGLAAAAATASTPPSWFAILGIGLAIGVFNVAALALMMGMADAKRTALFMGVWTMAHAIANGTAVAGGGVLYEGARAVWGSIPGGYATVFAIEAVGLALCIPVLNRIDPRAFRAQAEVSAPMLPPTGMAGLSGSGAAGHDRQGIAERPRRMTPKTGV